MPTKIQLFLISLIHNPRLVKISSISNPTNQVSTPIKASSAPIYNWDAEADTFALSVYRFGKTVAQITVYLAKLFAKNF